MDITGCSNAHRQHLYAVIRLHHSERLSNTVYLHLFGSSPAMMCLNSSSLRALSLTLNSLNSSGSSSRGSNCRMETVAATPAAATVCEQAGDWHFCTAACCARKPPLRGPSPPPQASLQAQNPTWFLLRNSIKLLTNALRSGGSSLVPSIPFLSIQQLSTP